MMDTLILALPGNESLAAAIADRLSLPIGQMAVRHFPDGETYVRIDTPVRDRHVVIVCGLHDPDPKIMSLVFTTATARELGAAKIGLVAPYLSYMRQDKRFQEGESVGSILFANLLSHYIDWIVTADPHLHRWKSLDDIYSVPSTVVHAAPLLADWIQKNVHAPILIGPDSESEQWVSAVARQAGAPHLVLDKVRRGDRDVVVSVLDAKQLLDRTPVLVDDIISTARTMIAALQQIVSRDTPRPICLGIHAVFSGDAYSALQTAGAANIVTTNTIPHPSNAIDVAPAVADAIAAYIL
jgi:ribose-phosphate pyrophosphokinase